MLVIISDLHLSDGTAVRQNISPKQMGDFWHNIIRSKKRLISLKKQPPEIELVILGDFLDVIRSNEWQNPDNKGVKPWSPASNDQKEVLRKIIRGIFAANAETFAILRKFSQSRQVRCRYMIGNHDHLLLRYPDLFREVHERVGFVYPEEDKTLNFYERFWHQYGVFAHHGDRGDPWNDCRGFLHPIGDAMVTEIYNRFPGIVSRALSGDDVLKHALENIVYIRPYRFAPYWVIQVTKKYGEEAVVKKCWNDCVEGFLEVDFVKHWVQETRKLSSTLNPATKLKATMRISRRLQFRSLAYLSRISSVLRAVFSVTPPSIKRIRKQLIAIDDPSVRYLVNGHTHNAGVLTVGKGADNQLAYVNTGTWTRSLLPDRVGPLEPNDNPNLVFTPGDFISYAIFFTQEEDPRNDMEFWSGRINPRRLAL